MTMSKEINVFVRVSDDYIRGCYFVLFNLVGDRLDGKREPVPTYDTNILFDPLKYLAVTVMFTF